jgi:hypothetical protein
MSIFWNSSPALMVSSNIFFFVLVVMPERYPMAFLTAAAEEF